MRSRRQLRQSTSPRLRQKTLLVYAVAATTIAAIIGGGVFLYFNLGNSRDTLAKKNEVGYVSAGNGDWESTDVWTKNAQWISDTPGENVNTDFVDVYGYITRNGDLQLGGSTSMNVYDTLRIKGNITVGAGSTITIHEGGLLIVENDYITNGGALSRNNGKVVGVQNFRGSGGAQVENNSLFYVYGDIVSSGGAMYNGSKNEPVMANFLGEQTLLNENPELHTFASGVGILPITLGYFKAKADKGKTLIEWMTINEKNNNFFTIERSPDAKQFQVLETMPGAGNSETELKYNFVDAYPLEGNSYYRLKQTDFDGQFEYFNIVAVHHESVSSQNTTELTIDNVWPNPFVTDIHIRFALTEDGPLTISLKNLGGKTVLEEVQQGYRGMNEISLQDHLGLSAGIYLLTVSHPAYQSKPIKVVKR
jgi:hypothetical protein